MDEKNRRKNAKQIDFQIRKSTAAKPTRKNTAKKQVRTARAHKPNNSQGERMNNQAQVRVRPTANQARRQNNEMQNATSRQRDAHGVSRSQPKAPQNRQNMQAKSKSRSADDKRRQSRAKGGMKIGGDNGSKSGVLTVINGGKSLPKMIKKFVIIGVCAVLVGAIVIFCATRPTGIGEWTKDYFAVGDEANGYPLSFSEFSANSMVTANNRIFVLGESEIRCYDSDGGKLFNRMHGFNSPIMRASKIRCLTYDLGGTQYRIDTVSDEIKTAKTENRIINGDIADNGSYAIATAAEKEAALVTVYDMNGTEKYKFRSAQRQLTRLAISPNGKKIAVCTVSAENSVLSSKIMVYSTDKNEPIYTESFDDEPFYSMKFDGNSRLCAVGSKRFFSTDFEDKKEYQFSNSSPEKVQFTDDGDVLICLSNASNSSQHTLKLFSAKAEEINSFDITGSVSAMSAGDDIYILSNTLDKYTYDGEKIKSFDIQAGVSGVGSAFGKAVVLYPTGITLV